MNTRPNSAFLDGRGPGPHTFFFDFDSTLFPGESLEELLALALADSAERDAAVSALEELGRKGMRGALPFEASLRGRLEIVRPHQDHIDAWVAEAEGRVSDGWQSLLLDLSAVGHQIFVVSGGFRPCIEPLVRPLGVDGARIHCNEFLFDPDGWVTGADESQPLSRSGGKATMIRKLVAGGGVPGLRIMVGDGATDLEAVAPGACNGILGYGVHAIREQVRDRADMFFDDADDFDHFLRSHFL